MKNYILVNPLKEAREGVDLSDPEIEKLYNQAQDPKGEEPKPEPEPEPRSRRLKKRRQGIRSP